MVSRRAIAITSLVFLGLLVATAVHQRRALGATVEAWSWVEAWKAREPGVLAISPAPDGLLLVSGSGLSVVGPDGTVLRRWKGPVVVGTTGDLDGDGRDEAIVAAGSPATVRALDLAFAERWSVTIPDAAGPARLLAVDLDGDGSREVVLGDTRGGLWAIRGRGKAWWRHAAGQGLSGEGAAVRGLDDVRPPRGERGWGVAFALRGGLVGVLAFDGKPRWSAKTDQVRRLRSIDLDGDRGHEVVTGHEKGAVNVWGADGRARPIARMGDAVTEIRAVEVDGDPLRPEVALGGKKGEVRVLRGPGALWTASIEGKVSAIGGVDLDGDGRQAVLVGTEEGSLTAFEADGRRLAGQAAGGKVEAIVAFAPGSGERLAVVAAGRAVTAWRLVRRVAPAWYRPETGAALGGLAVIACALGLLFLRPAPVAAAEPEPDGRALHVAKLREDAARVRSLLEAGRASREDALERLGQIEAQLARAARGPSAAASPAPPASPPPPPRRGGGS